MKYVGKLTFILIAFLALTASAYAQSPREGLQEMVEQLQKTPDDNALRERIIKLSAEIKPTPVIPEEAERHMAYGTAAFQGAKWPADFQESAKEFEQATLAAPWYGDAYFNLGVAQDKAENYEAALRSLNLARLASPDSKDIKALIYQVEYRNKKKRADGDAAQVRSKNSIEGAWFAVTDAIAPGYTWPTPAFIVTRHGNSFEVTMTGKSANGSQLVATNIAATETTLRFTYEVYIGLPVTYDLHREGEFLIGQSLVNNARLNVERLVRKSWSAVP
jgi:tetratricopeptide (TPR) repeat protein